MTLHLDFETRSRIDLLAHGAYIYAAHPSTDVMCMAWAIDDDKPQLWWPGDDLPDVLVRYFSEGARRSIHAHNAQFERLISKHVMTHYGLPEAPLKAFYCSASQARRRALPGSLENLGKALKLGTQKKLVGKQLIRKLCIPWLNGRIDFARGAFNKDPDLLKQMGEYCLQDVEVERTAALMSPPLTDDEFEDYIISEKINDRGLMVDLELATAAMNYADEETAEIGQRLKTLTNGEVETPRQFARLKSHLERYLEADDDLRRLVTRHKTDRKTGETSVKISFDKNARFNILAGNFDPHVMGVMQLMDDAGRSSTAKFRQMGLRAGVDARVRGAYMYCGASQTARYSSVGLQLHNFSRDCAKDPEYMRETIVGGYELDDPMNDLASMLRPAIISKPGRSFVCSDFASVEARILQWVTASQGGSDVLAQYAAVDADPSLDDMYVRQAEAMGIDDRQIGKVTTLSCGYQGGAKAFQTMARNYGLLVTEDEADRYKTLWRNANPRVVELWGDVDRAVMRAVRRPGEAFEAGRVSYVYQEEWDTLWCVLPSGKTLAYPQPRLDTVKTPWGEDKLAVTAIKAAWTPAAGKDDWPRIALYGGLCVENFCQGIGAELLNHVLRGMEQWGWDCVTAHTHDEVLAMPNDDEIPECKKTLEYLMTHGPTWASSLPLATSTWIGKRFRK